ncbi:MAG: tRNA (N6-threonylcarbamoyladenosine(37)-N6)-methyltransferase TrmO [Thermoprotei archaeon]|nr:MAG: tRNA (N6-threonylcarbamoyladenosine(37)-N6)-methyltransferase TrmO [Thermoprotei archaeon]
MTHLHLVEEERVCYRPIGVVERGVPRRGGARRPSRYRATSIVRVYDEYADGLRGLEEYSHVIVIYHLHEVREVKLVIGGGGVEVGIFATRAPYRPNPLGVTVVELCRVEIPRLYVRGLDAWTGTPVLDLKPYTYWDVVRRPKIPSWLRARWLESKSREGYDVLTPWLGPPE